MEGDYLLELLSQFGGLEFLSQKVPKLKITSLTNEPGVESQRLEANNKGLKFRKLSNDQIIVEVNEKTEVEHFTEHTNRQKLMLYNFEKMENFCQRFGKDDLADGVDKIVYRFYVLVKNFSDEKIHVPGQEAKVYIISKDYNLEYFLGFVFTVYANGKHDEQKGYLYINIKKVKSPLRITGETVLYISVIDNDGNDRFTQTEVFYENHDGICDTDMINNDLTLCKCISRETILCNPLELLHGDDLVLYINIAFDRPPHITETEKKIHCSFKKQSDGMFVLFLDSDIGRILGNKSNFFLNKLKENEIFPIPEVEEFRNICRLLLEASYIKVNNFEDIYNLYKLSHQYEIVAVVEFCRLVFKKHGLYVGNIPLILDLAESYKDEFLNDIALNSLKFHKKYERFICNFFNFACVRQESPMDDLISEHIHYARGEYIECDNRENVNQQYFSFSAKCYEEESKFNFFSVFNICENEEITLPLDSHFGKILCEKSNVLKHMLECTGSESQKDDIEIPQKKFEAFKNIYRLFMGANYLKATTISDIISLYEVCDYYDIPLVMEICRNLFKKHICIRNGESILDLSKRCRGDIELEKIVLDFKADYERYVAGIRHPEFFQFGSDNFVELDEILGFQHNFNVYQ